MKRDWIILAAFLLSVRVCAGAEAHRTGLQIVLTSQSHPSGLYHSGDQTTLKLRITNPGPAACMLSGNLRWMLNRGLGKALISQAATPIRPTMLTDGQIVRIVLPETFTATGKYELFWHHIQVRSAKACPGIRCIYAPCPNLAGRTPAWIASMPRSFLSGHNSEFIGSYVRETGIRQYLLNIRLSDSRRPDFAAISASLKQSGAWLIPVLTISSAKDTLRRQLSRQRLFGQLRPIAAICRAVVVRFAGPPTTASSIVAAAVIPRLHDVLQTLHSSARVFATPDVIGAGQGNLAWTSLIGGVALSDTFQSLQLCHQLAQSDAALPVMILPNSYTLHPAVSDHAVPNPALFLTSAATYVPIRHGGNHFELHVLGAGRLFSIVHPHLPLLAAVFKQTYGSCAIVAGLGSGLPADEQWRAWRDTPPLMVKKASWNTTAAAGGSGWKRLLTHVPPAGQFPHGKMIVVDAEGLMATRDSQGRHAPTAYPGWQEIPLGQHVYFLTYPGTPSDLAAALRTASIKGLPLADITRSADAAHQASQEVTLMIHNARVGRLQAMISIWTMGTSQHNEVGTQVSPNVHFGPIHGGDSAYVTLPLKRSRKIPTHTTLMAVLIWHHLVEISPLANGSHWTAHMGPQIVRKNPGPPHSQAGVLGDKVPPSRATVATPKDMIHSPPSAVQAVELPYMPSARMR